MLCAIFYFTFAPAKKDQYYLFQRLEILYVQFLTQNVIQYVVTIIIISLALNSLAHLLVTVFAWIYNVQ